MTDRASNRGALELIVFDFDGTLCDSAEVKTQAFYDLYFDSHGPAIARAVKEHHLANVGVSRYDKIRWAEGEFFGGDPTDGDVERVARGTPDSSKTLSSTLRCSMAWPNSLEECHPAFDAPWRRPRQPRNSAGSWSARD